MEFSDQTVDIRARNTQQVPLSDGSDFVKPCFQKVKIKFEKGHKYALFKSRTKIGEVSGTAPKTGRTPVSCLGVLTSSRPTKNKSVSKSLSKRSVNRQYQNNMYFISCSKTACITCFKNTTRIFITSSELLLSHPVEHSARMGRIRVYPGTVVITF